VRRANIVENPLLRRDPVSEPRAQTAAPADRAVADLGLDMDYDELMRYFDNLKESNA